jgi:hypothetical protein
MQRFRLRDDQWERIKDFLPVEKALWAAMLPGIIGPLIGRRPGTAPIPSCRRPWRRRDDFRVSARLRRSEAARRSLRTRPAPSPTGLCLTPGVRWQLSFPFSRIGG